MDGWDFVKRCRMYDANYGWDGRMALGRTTE
jgi:hypothetical protein